MWMPRFSVGVNFRFGGAGAKGMLLALPIACFSLPVHSETLIDALVQAYQSNPQLQSQRAALRATDETVPQALSGWRPQVTASGSYGHQRTRTEQPLSFIGAGATISNDRTVSPLGVDVTVRQPLFRGGQTYYGTRRAEAGVRAGREQLSATEQSVLLSTVTAYMDVVADGSVVALNNNQVEVLSRQLEASNDRFRVGEITRTGVAQSEARLSASKSSLTAAEASLTASKSAYERIVGQLPVQLDPPPPLPALPETEEAAVEMALSNNPTLRAALEAERASAHAVQAEIGRLLPSVSLEGNAQLAEDQGSEGFQQDQIGVAMQVSVPLYQSGAVYSSVRQARQVNSQRKLEAAQARRQVIEGVHNAWEGLRSARARIVSDEAAVRANRIALDGVRQEAEVGSRTTLDVLDAEQELLNTQVALVRSQRNEYVAAYSLLAAIGGLTAGQIGLPVEIYDPVEHYDRVHYKLLGTRDRWQLPGFGSDENGN
ncbi:MAG TPA: hypothetical protein DDW95_04915 [Alphaproteobacteria bacterium]|nr:hypothetical protein [Alphaproteobacteria bacterium]HBC54470.1 hypothetical protein [Alphaproteobacteria bacterium]HBF97871.1 hypothetical protein [Alphaproteobacteria bacterium]